ncbi:MAG: hypothetical protein A2790_00745 [Phenylobacterium sp. RIFCSPHIGHO2_01_FULL_69_31]|uniref:hypothetical protein n=1 Tax=Phenylobacterium sp. RIFCSPHIGHO2_01_FULL_69_31 TaxID=1801944 RepID=UPI0008B64760|nr:hypothetical protein [Phenylobacterium sp. RIFCSPHIGHO2_01_FULL_69_31]OHB27224.1 MAG: hypothetical protein A2790_00745 [Phenylobacterium sp. RIFCSPHIGHO2_01_FULL_69_31]
MTFAKWVFTIGGLWGVLIIGSLFFLEPVIASQTGPLSHPDTYYGFAVSTFAMQIGYLVIGRNPAAYRPFMLIGAGGKLAYAGVCWALYAQGRIPVTVPALASPDLLLAALFVAAWFKTKPAAA